MEKVFNAPRSAHKALGKMLGYTALLALVFQFFVPGFFGAGTVSAQTATTTSITVTKVVVGGDMVAGDFELFVNGTSVTSGVALEFAPGTVPMAPLVITETPVDGYTATFSGDCDALGTVSIEEGEELECIITNTFTATSTDLSADIDANGSDGPVIITDGEEWSYSWTSEDATSCQITSPSGTSGVTLAGTGGPIGPDHDWYPEIGDPTTLTLDCTDGVDSVSDSVIISVVAPDLTDITSITVTKVVEGGDMEAGEFELFVNATPVVSGVPLVFASTSIPTAPLVISETPVDGYTATFSGDCAADGSVSIELGEELECVITNTFGDISATSTSLTVTKVVQGGGDLTAEDFPLFVSGVGITSGVATTTLAAGTYFISEISNADYDASFSGDCAANGSITLVPGVAAECIITNTFDPGDTAGDDDDDSRTPSQFNPNVNVNVDSPDVNVQTGDTDIVLGGTSTFPVGFPGQVLGAGSVVPVYYPVSGQPGQVLGAQSYVPGLPTTGAEPLSERLPNIGLIALAGLMATVGAGLIVAPSSRTSSSRFEDMR